jgi:ATP-dependent RNA circularization protein (DNA/RNA ligase family)
MKYHKIQTVYKRDPATKYKTLLEGEYSLPEFEYLKYNEWEWTEKVNGTNIRVFCDGNSTCTFEGRSNNSQIPASLFNKLKEMFPVDKFIKGFGETPIILFGEGYGPKIQKGGGNYREDVSFVLFDVKINGYWLSRDNVEDIADNLGIDHVPIIGSGDLYEMIEYVYSGFKSQWGDFEAEGIVARPSVELLTRTGERIITKIKRRDFKNFPQETA